MRFFLYLCTQNEFLLFMQYTVIHLEYNFEQEWEEEIFQQELADLGVEVFDQADAYIPTTQWEEAHTQIISLIDQYPQVTLIGYENCPDQNWNEAWEAEHEPILLPMDVRITPHCAFGAGHHQTTTMMVNAILEAHQQGRLQPHTHLLDMGCGTGILAIMAKKCGAGHVTAVDIDDKSVSNTQENAQDNHVHIRTILASTPPEGQYDFILANIHRNILIQQLPLYAQFLLPKGEIWMSGFYEQDIPHITQAAEECGLQHIQTIQLEEWRMIILTHQA
jgi:ribosomal protein L11 methyltransferase